MVRQFRVDLYSYSIVFVLMSPAQRSPSLLSTMGRLAIWFALGLAAIACLAVWAACDERSRSLLLNTLLLASVVCAVSVPIGAALAFLLIRTDLPGRRIFACLLGGMLLMPLYLQAGSWQAGFGLDGWYSLNSGGQAWLMGWRGAIWVHILASLPWVTLIIGLGLRFVEPELEEQALLDGSVRQVLLGVTFPRAALSFVAAIVWISVWTAGEMTVTDLFQVRTYAEELYTETAVERAPGQASLAILPGVAVTAMCVLATLWIASRWVPSMPTVIGRPPWVFQLGRARWPFAMVVALLIFLVVGIPLLNLAWRAGMRVNLTSEGRVREWSFAKSLSMIPFSLRRNRHELQWSLIVAATSATLVIIVATLLAWRARSSRISAGLTALLAALSFALPGPIVGLAMIAVFNRPDSPVFNFLYDQSIVPLCLAQFIRGLPLALLVIWYALQSIPTEMIEHAELDGIPWWTRLLRIALPQRRGALALAWGIAFALGLGELSAGVLVAPPGLTTLTLRIFGLLHYGVEDQVAGICLALYLLFQLAMVPLARIVK
jgi:iron(III) transport system permease protein